MVLALKRYGAQSVVGIDISLNVLGTSEIDKIACLENIDLNECELIEGEIGVYPLGKGSFDLITLFNVIEHVERPFELLANLHDLLREGGILCISSAPLFYSPIGHHCWHIFPRETHPWVHLIDHNFLDILKEKDLRAANFYLGLNKITSSDILNIIRTIGFRIKKQDLYFALEKIEDHPENYKIFKSVAPNFEDLTIEG